MVIATYEVEQIVEAARTAAARAAAHKVPCVRCGLVWGNKGLKAAVELSGHRIPDAIGECVVCREEASVEWILASWVSYLRRKLETAEFGLRCAEKLMEGKR